MRALWLAAVLAGLTACSSDYQAPPPPPAPPPTVVAAPPPPPVVKPVDTCGAADLQHLVGRPRTEIPVPVHPDRQRVVCTTCPMTMDHNPQRLNFLFDAETGTVRNVRCG
jgi:Peptidase inhibitor I78 family